MCIAFNFIFFINFFFCFNLGILNLSAKVQCPIIFLNVTLTNTERQERWKQAKKQMTDENIGVKEGGVYAEESMVKWGGWVYVWYQGNIYIT